MDFYLLDSKVIIDYISNRFSITGNTLFESLLDEKRAIITSITQIEVLGYNTLTLDNRVKIQELFDLLIIEPLSKEIAETAIKIRQTAEKVVKTPDAVIAATAVHYQITLITTNTRDSSHPSLEINLLNLHDINE